LNQQIKTKEKAKNVEKMGPNSGMKKEATKTNIYLGVPKTLGLKIQARIWLVANLDTKDLLVHGQMGEIIDLGLKDNEGNDFCVIKFDEKNCGVEHRKKYEHILSEKHKEKNGTPIFRQNIKYTDEDSAFGEISQFPIRLAFGMTYHRAQGLTKFFYSEKDCNVQI